MQRTIHQSALERAGETYGLVRPERQVQLAPIGVVVGRERIGHAARHGRMRRCDGVGGGEFHAGHLGARFRRQQVAIAGVGSRSQEMGQKTRPAGRQHDGCGLDLVWPVSVLSTQAARATDRAIIAGQ